jgi:hypothetical protein
MHFQEEGSCSSNPWSSKLSGVWLFLCSSKSGGGRTEESVEDPPSPNQIAALLQFDSLILILVLNSGIGERSAFK